MEKLSNWELTFFLKKKKKRHIRDQLPLVVEIQVNLVFKDGDQKKLRTFRQLMGFDWVLLKIMTSLLEKFYLIFT